MWEAASLGKPVIATRRGSAHVPAEVIQPLHGESAPDVVAKCRRILRDANYLLSLQEKQHLATSGISAHLIELHLREQLDEWMARGDAASVTRDAANPHEEGDR